MSLWPDGRSPLKGVKGRYDTTKQQSFIKHLEVSENQGQPIEGKMSDIILFQSYLTIMKICF